MLLWTLLVSSIMIIGGQQDFYEEYKRVLGISYELKKQMSQQKNLKEELFLQIKDL